MDETKIATLEASVADAKTQADAAGGTDANLNQKLIDAEKILTDAKAALSQSPIDKAIEDGKRVKRTKLEKAEFARKKIDAQISFLKGESSVVPEDDDDAPVTRGDLKKLQIEQVEKTALDRAGEITDLKERELVIHHLTNTIKSTGDPQKDLELAYSIVHSTKNTEIAEELARGGVSRALPGSRGAPPKPAAGVFTPTADEQAMMRPPFNLTEAQIVAARKTST